MTLRPFAAVQLSSLDERSIAEVEGVLMVTDAQVANTDMRWTDATHASHFLRAEEWAQRHRHPLFLGEFGAYERADMASRVRWTDCVARQAEALGWSWAYWQFDSDFILYDINRDRWVEPIRDALIAPDGHRTEG